MKTPLICRSRSAHGHSQRGITMVLVALAMVAIIGMAALSIDVITLYLAKQDAQRSADDAALAAGKVISVSGITGDPNNVAGNWGSICAPDGLATRAAKAVANQNLLGGPVITPTVTYSSSGTSGPDCTALSATGFGVNPIVTVQLTRSNLPTFFSRIWGYSGNTINATATAEVFNPSYSGNSGNQITGTITPVQPRCVKPIVVPNQDPLHFRSGAVGICTGGSTGNCAKIVNPADGSIVSKGISVSGGGTGGIIGETFWLNPDCRWAQTSCTFRINPPQANYNNGSGYMNGPPNLIFAPGQVGTPVIGVPSCTTGDEFEVAIEGCDAPTNYTCGLPPTSGGTNAIDFSRSPDRPTRDGVSCLIHEASGWGIDEASGQDYLNSNPFLSTPSAYPFQISSGNSVDNPAVKAGLASGTPISVSPSIVSLPIYDESTPLTAGGITQVTFVGFLQVFINAVDQFGNINVTVLNVAGCGDGNTTPVSVTPVTGNSPVPVRLITPP